MPTHGTKPSFSEAPLQPLTAPEAGAMRLPTAPLKLYWRKEPIPSQQIMKAKIQTLNGWMSAICGSRP
jgi:hypothetical protein